jgi:hypothetical protein
MKKSILIFICVFSLTFSAKAQTNEGFEAILFANSGDANKLINAYINPAMKGLIYSMNNGWYHTAKVHKKLGFDISIGLNAATVPSSDEIFSLANLGLSSTITGSTTNYPTVAGTTTTGTLNILIPANSLPDINGGTHPALTASIKMPDGVKDDLPLNAVPAPAVQFNLGLPFKMEAMLRLVPKVGSDDVKGQLLGIGLKKEITSWFGPLDKLPLHVSLLAAYTSMNVDYDISNDSNITNDGQAEFKLTAYTIEAIASLNFPFINVYGGLGYGSGSSDLNLNGNYNLDYNSAGGTVKRTLKDPIKQKFDASGFKSTLGARISLGFFKIFGSYTFQDYNTINAGIAFSIR